jgi:hypothetical protein
MKVVTALVALLLVMFSASTAALGCECIRDTKGKSLRELLKESKGVIFYGHVTAIREVKLPSDRPGTHTLQRDVTLSNIEVGARTLKTVTVRTGIGRGDCGYPFEVSGEYLIEMYYSKGRYRTNICNLTMPLQTALDQMDLPVSYHTSSGGAELAHAAERAHRDRSVCP